MTPLNLPRCFRSRSRMKYVLVTGGVISGIGKGVVASSIGVLLQHSGVSVTAIKIDPYINIGQKVPLSSGTPVQLSTSPFVKLSSVHLSTCPRIHLSTPL